MMHAIRLLVGLATGLALAGCTTTYTQADLVKEEVKQDADMRSEVRYDDATGQEGGAGYLDVEDDADRGDVDGERYQTD